MSSILLIGTTLNKLTYLALLLEEAGYTTYRCQEWTEMDQVVAQKRPNLIIADDCNSEEYALMLTNHLQANPDYADLPVILLAKTAVSAAAIDQNLIKPILPHELFLTIGKILQVNKKDEPQPRNQPAPYINPLACYDQ